MRKVEGGEDAARTRGGRRGRSDDDVALRNGDEQARDLRASDVLPYAAVAPYPPEEVLQPAPDVVGEQVSIGGVHCNNTRKLDASWNARPRQQVPLHKCARSSASMWSTPWISPVMASEFVTRPLGSPSAMTARTLPTQTHTTHRELHAACSSTAHSFPKPSTVDHRCSSSARQRMDPGNKIFARQNAAVDFI